MKMETQYRVYCGVNGHPYDEQSFYCFKTKEEALEDIKWRTQTIGKAGYYYDLVEVTFKKLHP